MPKKKKSQKQKEEVTFEQAIEQLEQIVHRLEDQQCGLDESLALYEEGVKLLKQCRAKLEEAEQKIKLLTGVDESGEPITEPFDATATIERHANFTAEAQTEPAAEQAEANNAADKQPRKRSPAGPSLFENSNEPA